MKHTNPKGLLAMLLVIAMMMSLLAACGGTSASSAETASSPAEASESVSEAAETPETEPDDAPDQDTPAEAPEEASAVEEKSAVEVQPVTYELPLYDEPMEISIFWCMRRDEKMSTVWWQRFCENLNVNIDFLEVSDTAAAQNYNLMIASGDLTDLIFENTCSDNSSITCPYPGGYDKAVEDGFYLDLREYLPEYCPNYWSLLNSDPSILKDVETDSGVIATFSMLYDVPYGSAMGILYDVDKLNDTGMDVPTTVEGWQDVLTAMKENGVQYPFGAAATGDLDGQGFSYAFGTTLSYAYKVEAATGEVVFDGTSQELRDYLEFFNSLYSDGMVSPDFFTDDSMDPGKYNTGAFGIYGGMSERLEDDVSYGLTLAAAPVVTLEGEIAPKIANYSNNLSLVASARGDNMVVTSACENLEDALKMMDWFYSKEGEIAVNFGWVEGESYEMVDGEPQLLEFITQTLENGDKVKDSYILDDAPTVYVRYREAAVSLDEVNEATAMWVDADYSSSQFYTMPQAISLTVEEGEIISSLGGDISTVVESSIMQFLTGGTPLTDESWNSYVEQVESMGVDQLIEIYQDAYDRYMAR